MRQNFIFSKFREFQAKSLFLSHHRTSSSSRLMRKVEKWIYFFFIFLFLSFLFSIISPSLNNKLYFFLNLLAVVFSFFDGISKKKYYLNHGINRFGFLLLYKRSKCWYFHLMMIENLFFLSSLLWWNSQICLFILLVEFFFFISVETRDKKFFGAFIRLQFPSYIIIIIIIIIQVDIYIRRFYLVSVFCLLNAKIQNTAEWKC